MRLRWILAGVAAVLVAAGSSVYASDSHGKGVSTAARTTTLQGQARGEVVSDLAIKPAVTSSTPVNTEPVNVQQTTSTACDTAKAELATLRQNDRTEDTTERQAAVDADKAEDQTEGAASKGEDEAESPADKTEDQAENAPDKTEDQSERAAVRAAQAAVRAACVETETEVEGTETETENAGQQGVTETDNRENANRGSGE